MRSALRVEGVLVFLIMLISLAILAAGGAKGCEKRLEESQPQLPTAVVTKVGVPVEYKGHTIMVEKIETVCDFFTGTQHRVYLKVDGKPRLLDPGGGFYTLWWVNRNFAFYFDPGGSTKLVLNKVSPDHTELEWAEVPAGWSEESARAEAR